jgi:hypothetical protein
MSKGSRNRTADLSKYSENFDAIFGKEDERRKALDAADLEAIVRPKEVERVCGNCKHYSDAESMNKSCMTLSYGKMCDELFSPSADFGCNKFEAKI